MTAATKNPSKLLEEIQKLMELKGENPFKIRAFAKAVDVVAGRDDLEERARSGTLTELAGIGKGISEVLTEYLVSGKSTVRDELAASLPPGLVEISQVSGLGPKKALKLIEELSIHSLGELEYACRENRLCTLKGFGQKTQTKILESLTFMKQNQGKQRLADLFPIAEKVLRDLVEAGEGVRVSETGALRRRMEVLSELEFLMELPADAKTHAAFRDRVKKVQEAAKKEIGGLKIRVDYTEARKFGSSLAQSTATPEHWAALGGEEAGQDFETEKEFYGFHRLPVIPPEARETGEEVAMARAGKLENLLPWDGVQGVFHNHTTRSDGANTLDEMVVAAKEMGYLYIGISDHSQSAFYAQGLRERDLEEQEREIQSVQKKHPEIRIFWGIESDILADGALDYPDILLKRFDFVVASIHSRFQMGSDEMTQRVIRAIQNPYTRFLGHATGRLLLGRKGYELDMPRIIAEAAKQDVAIEINAHPARLDIDWRWGPLLRKHRTLVSINPDAHSVDGLSDTRYGILVARKALLSGDQVVNTRSVAEIERWLKRAR